MSFEPGGSSRGMTTNTVNSKDGTRIAFDRVGEGPPVILVGGAFSERRYKGMLQLADLLASRFTVINYDRRGRGDSGDTAPYSVERELEDLGALIESAGGSASVWGMSSGAVLALRAAAAGLRIEKLALYQPPFTVDRTGHLPPEDLGPRLAELIAAGRRGQAVKYFITKGMGAPAVFVGLMRLAPPMWRRLKAVAHTLPYDYAIMGDTVNGKPLAPEPWGSVAAPTLVIDGAKSPASLRSAADALAEVVPHARRRTLEGQSHSVSMKMSRLVVSQFMSIDGVVEDPGGVEGFQHGGWAMHFDRGRDGSKFKLDEIMAGEALLLGRATYETFADSWPARTGEFADKMNGMPKYVVSTTLAKPAWNNSTAIAGNVAQEVARLKRDLSGDILVHGSTQLVQTLIEHDLVDEYRLMVFPTVLGAGKRLVGELSVPPALRLRHTKPAGEAVILVYDTVRGARA
jgi:dihydrofolate reductase/pimeloyl-ACP methyl ester carboxylesterase